jgi:hypothetical protein
MRDYDSEGYTEERYCPSCYEDHDHAVHPTGWGIETICRNCGHHRGLEKAELQNEV